MTRRASFRLTDLARAIKAFERAGVGVTGAKIQPDGSIVVLTSEKEAANDRGNPLDRVLGP